MDITTKNTISLEDARDLWSDAIWSDGGHCPCCKRWGKVYTRRLNRAMCDALTWLSSQELHEGWVDVPNRGPKWLLRTNQLPSLRWWGLVVRHVSDEAVKKHTGKWKITEEGLEFLSGGRIPESVTTYDGSVLAMSSTLVSLDEVNNNFNYQEIMET